MKHVLPTICVDDTDRRPRRITITAPASPYAVFTHNVLPVPALSQQIRRSNSWSESFEDYRFQEDVKDPEDNERTQHEANSRLLDVHRCVQYDQFKHAYARVLYCWGLLDKRVEVLKHVYVPPDGHKGVEFGTICHVCRREVRGEHCHHCKNYAFQCAICRISVKGASNFCLACSHGGHAAHMAAWFRTHDVCPTGCGCYCLSDNPMVES